MTRIAVGFGSNLGDRQAHLDAGLAAIARHNRLVARSALYESAPVGPVEQGPFLNAVAVFDTSLEPQVILSDLLAIEQTRGRVREVRWGPRTLDLDLLLYGSAAIEEEGLTVPHSELTHRRFVLQPLLEAWPDAVLPNGTTLASFADGVGDQRVELFGPWRVPWWSLVWWRVRAAVSSKQ